MDCIRIQRTDLRPCNWLLCQTAAAAAAASGMAFSDPFFSNMGYLPHLSEDSKTTKVPSTYPTCDKNVCTYLANKVSVPLLNEDRGAP
jgi:hypothetical protein